MIQFTRDEQGRQVARLDDLEVRLGDAGYEIIVWGVLADVPCDYSDKGCPAGRELQTCPVVDECPYEFTEVTQDRNWFESGFEGWAEVEARVRDLFRNQWRYEERDDPAAQAWPQPAASRFAEEPWAFDQQPR